MVEENTINMALRKLPMAAYYIPLLHKGHVHNNIVREHTRLLTEFIMNSYIMMN